MASALVIHRDAHDVPIVATVGGLLPRHEMEALLAAAIEQERWFVEASTEGRSDYRSAAVLYTIVDEAMAVVDRVCSWAGQAAERLGLELPRQPRVEHQLTAYRPGDHYGLHRDDDGVEPQGRCLTYVYYFHRLPRAFAGGQLLVHPGPLSIAPTVNQLVFFPSRLEHEVRAVTPKALPVGFTGCRFTLNGWLWR
jgi:SM-20-related protein